MQPSLFSTQSGRGAGTGSGAGAGGRSVAGTSSTRTQSTPAPTANTGEVDSWIEVSSHPSDSQYTSSSDDHIITAGLRISQTRRKRRGTARPSPRPQEVLDADSDCSDSDDDGEAEDMGSMIHSMPMSSDGYSSPDDDDESDDEASASDSNARARTIFSSSANSSSQRPSVPYRRQTTPAAASRSHTYTGYNSFAPNHAADHDAALRASLSTLLSCAAAARGLPKSTQSQVLPPQPQTGRVAVDSLTLVRESGEPSGSPTITTTSGKTRSLSIASTTTTTSSSSRSPSSTQLTKQDGAKKTRKHSSARRRSSRSRAAREAESEMTLANIPYMTLAISAGAIVVLSAITFSAGYALGKEVGKGEGGLLRSVEGGRAVVKGTGGIGMGTRFTSVKAF